MNLKDVKREGGIIESSQLYRVGIGDRLIQKPVCA